MRIGRQLSFGFATVIGATLVTGAVAVAALETTVAEKDRLAHGFADDLARVENLRYRAEQVVATTRGLMLTKGEPPDADFSVADQGFRDSLRRVDVASPKEQQDIDAVHAAWVDYLAAARNALRHCAGDSDAAGFFEVTLLPARLNLERRLDILVADEEHEQVLAFERSRASARRAAIVLALTTLLGVAMSGWLAYVLRRRMVNVVVAREEVLAVVSHDLRNPLAGIALACRAGARKADAVTAGYFARIQDASQRMEQIIEELLDTARAEKGLLELNRQRVDLPPLVTGTVKMFEEQLAEKKVQLVLQLPEHVDVRVDARRIGRVIINLVSNALKFTPEGGRITVRAEPAGAFERVSVSDTGPGMEREQLPNLFQKHWQLHKAQSGGLGLGLYIVRVLVEAHGGSVQVESRPGEGSTFSFTVPRA